MTHLLDSNAVYDLLVDPSLASGLPVDAETHISALTVMEMNFGIASAKTAPAATTRTTQLMTVLRWWSPVSLDAAMSIAFLRIAQNALSLGQDPRARMNDLMIGATALARGWTLVTADRQLTRAVHGLLPVVSLRT